MKKGCILILISYYACTLCGQPVAGIYKTSGDFLQGTLFSSDKNSHARLHKVIRKNYIDLVHHDSSYRFLKSELYGYCDKEGNAYRFYNDTIYPIMNPGEKILIYKINNGTGLKNSPVTESWFFSKDAGSDILPLTMANLLISFRENKPFTGLLEVYCRNETNLTDYDQTHGIYKLNRLLEISAQFK
jgi:hypothetical protein